MKPSRNRVACDASRVWVAMGNWLRPQGSAAGGVVEWLMAPVLKTGEAKASVGSNPTPSVDRP
jgi:hypothetical protein